MTKFLLDNLDFNQYETKVVFANTGRERALPPVLLLMKPQAVTENLSRKV